MRTVRPIPADFTIAIRYPTNASKVVHGRGVKVYLCDGDDNRTLITTCGALSVHAEATGIVWAEAELFCTEDGKPIFTGNGVVHGAQLLTKVFSCHVIEIQSETSYTTGFREAYEYTTGKPTPLTALRMVGRRAVREVVRR